MKNNYSKFFILFSLIYILFSCEKNTIYKPVQYTKDEFMKASKEKAKALQEKEKNIIKNWIKNETKDNFTEINGIWINLAQNNSKPKAQTLDAVTYTVQMEDLEGNIIYTYQEIGEIKGIIGKTHEIRGVEVGLQLMSKGDEATLLLPSFMAYGLYGDENKIGKNQPLLIHIKLKDIQKINPKK